MIKIVLILLNIDSSKNLKSLNFVNKGINKNLIIYYYKERNYKKVIEFSNDKADANFKDKEGSAALFYLN